MAKYYILTFVLTIVFFFSQLPAYSQSFQMGGPNDSIREVGTVMSKKKNTVQVKIKKGPCRGQSRTYSIAKDNIRKNISYNVGDQILFFLDGPCNDKNAKITSIPNIRE